MEDGVLYRKSYLVPLMRCVGPLQANYVNREVHIGSCGMHDGPRQVVAKAMNLGYYWPFMHRDVRELIRACDDCQAHAAVPRLPKADMISATSAWPFMNVNEKTNDKELRLILDLLDEQREIAAIREAKYKQHVKKYYNKKMRHVQFKVGEFVLRRNEVSRAANTGKLGPTWEGPYKVIQAFQSGAYKLSNMEGEEIPRT
ncbi:reverse transcriptase domain-containing protein [Tanacetum coccineum]